MNIPGLLWAISFHEFCHGWAAYKLGDLTAARQGRLSLNPLRHLDPVGTIMLLLFRFGWAKPVQINSRKFRNPRRDIALVALAGPAGNFISAAVITVIAGLLFRLSPNLFLGTALGGVVANMMFINVGLGVFNLIPIPPLDGSKALSVLLPVSALNGFFFLERYGFFIIIGLSYIGVTGFIMSPFFEAAEYFWAIGIYLIGGRI